MKKLIISFFLFTITLNLFAEDSKLHFGLKAAPSLAWLRTDTKDLESDGSIFGFSYGFITEFRFSDKYAFATGIDITYRGGKLKFIDTQTPGVNTTITTTTSTKFSLQYVELPLTLKLKTNEIGYLTYFLQAGIAPGMNIRARADVDSSIQTTISGSTTTNNPKSVEGIDVKDGINSVNLSMIIGGGLEYTLSGSTTLLVGLQFNNGFLDVFDGDEKVNSNYLALTIGILF